MSKEKRQEESIVPEKKTYFFPTYDCSVEAESEEEALQIVQAKFLASNSQNNG